MMLGILPLIIWESEKLESNYLRGLILKMTFLFLPQLVYTWASSLCLPRGLPVVVTAFGRRAATLSRGKLECQTREATEPLRLNQGGVSQFQPNLVGNRPGLVAWGEIWSKQLPNLDG